ncbi:MAG: type 4a pilus biogenesis protein PilO [Pseudomonadota bacterium]
MQSFLVNTPPRTLLLLMLSTALVVVTAVATYAVWPEYRDYRKSLTTLRLLENVTARGDTLEREMTELQERVAALQHRLHGDMIDLPSNQMESFIIGRLQGISWRNHIELLSVTPGTGNRMQVFDEVLFNVRVSGDYFDLYRWLQDMREELGYVVVKQFDITPGPVTDSTPQLIASLTIVSYREAPDA